MDSRRSHKQKILTVVIVDGISYITKRYRTPKKLAESSVNLQLKTGCLYMFASAIDECGVVIVDTSPAVGEVSGEVIWRYRVEPHPWAGEVAAIIWDLEQSNIVRGVPRPDKSAIKKGWICQIRVETVPDVRY